MMEDKQETYILIRAEEEGDAAELLEIWRHPDVARNLARLPDMSLAEARERVRPRPNRHALVAEIEGKVVGQVALWQDENPRLAHSAGLGLAVHPGYWGKTVGTRLMVAILDLADNWLNLRRVELEVHVDNPAALALYEKVGFEKEGVKRQHMVKDGRLVDSYLMARIR